MTPPDEPPSVEDRLRVVRAMWSTYREHGVEAALPCLSADVEFVDHLGHAFHGHDGVRRFFAAFGDDGERFVAFAYGFEARGGELLASGHRRVLDAADPSGEALYFAHRVRDGRIVRVSAHRTREAALAGIAGRDTAAR